MSDQQGKKGLNTIGEFVNSRMQDAPPQNILSVFYGYATGGNRLRIKRYDAANPVDHAFLTHVFRLADMPAPAALSERTGAIARKDVVNAFAAAARKADVPMVKRTWMETRLRLGLSG